MSSKWVVTDRFKHITWDTPYVPHESGVAILLDFERMFFGLMYVPNEENLNAYGAEFPKNWIFA